MPAIKNMFQRGVIDALDLEYLSREQDNVVVGYMPYAIDGLVLDSAISLHEFDFHVPNTGEPTPPCSTVGHSRHQIALVAPESAVVVADTVWSPRIDDDHARPGVF